MLARALHRQLLLTMDAAGTELRLTSQVCHKPTAVVVVQVVTFSSKARKEAKAAQGAAAQVVLRISQVLREQMVSAAVAVAQETLMAQEAVTAQLSCSCQIQAAVLMK